MFDWLSISKRDKKFTDKCDTHLISHLISDCGWQGLLYSFFTYSVIVDKYLLYKNCTGL